jgi:hypothetical protein
MQKSTPEVLEAAGGALGPMEEVVEEAAVVAGGEGVTASPKVTLEVAIRSLEIQDAEPIRSTLMTEATASTRGGIELLADDLVEPATVAKHLEAIRQAEQWIKVSSRSFLSSQSSVVEYSCDLSCRCRMLRSGPATSRTCCKAMETRCSELRH